MNRKIAIIILVSIISLAGAGCSINQLTHEGLTAQAETRSGTVTVADKAEGLDGGKVGWGRITIFAIPVVPIYIQGDESVQLMENIQEALVLAGYSAVPAASTQDSQQLVLNATVNKKRYSNYTWLVPLVPTWGGMDVTLSLTNSSGDIVWSEGFKGNGFTMNFFDGYNVASKESMSEMLNAMTLAFISDDFYHALNGGALASAE